MNQIRFVLRGILLLFLLVTVPAEAFDKNTPLHPGGSGQKEGETALPDTALITLKASLHSPLFAEFPMATVNGEPIRLKDLAEVLASSHEERAEKGHAAKIDYSELLKRLVNIKLILQEASRMGFDELPEVKEMVDVYSKKALREQLLATRLKSLEPDKDEVEKVYREMVKEWKIRSVLFEEEEDAQRMAETIKVGKSFEEMVDAVLADKTAKGGEQGAFVKPKDLLPQIAEAAEKMEPGAVSPVTKIETGKGLWGYTLFKLLETGYPEDPEAREGAYQEVLGRKKTKVLKEYANSLFKKNAKVNWKLLSGLNYEAKSVAVQKLSKDKRTVATIKGGKPITVGELTEALTKNFYHGVKLAVEGKRVNEIKVPTLEALLEKRLFMREALREGIDKTGEYKRAVREYRDSVIFGLFVQKVVLPDIKVNDEEIEKYYRENIKEFSSPAMLKIRGLSFVKREYAESAIEKLRKGTDFGWLMSNAEGQAEKDAGDLLSFDGRLLTVSSLPDAVRKSVEGVQPGEVRLHESNEGHAYALLVQQVVPPKPEPLAAVRSSIYKKLFDEKLKGVMEEWAEKLLKSSVVKRYFVQ